MNRLTPRRRPQEAGTPLAMPARSRVKLVLHRGIVTGTIPGGTRLVQSCIAEELAVSTRPVRDALRELAAEGFVRLDGRGAAVVRELGRSELEDIYEIRMMLEPVAAARAAQLASAASLIRAGELLTVDAGQTDSAQWAEHNASFHQVIDEAGSSPRLVAILGNLRELSARYITHSVRTVPGPGQPGQRRARGDPAGHHGARPGGGGGRGDPAPGRHAVRADMHPVTGTGAQSRAGLRVT